MKSTVYKSAVIGGIIVFIWGMFSWMVLPWHGMCMKHFKNESAVAAVIKENTDSCGAYVLPNMHAAKNMSSPKDREAMMMAGEKMMYEGPVMFAGIRTDGMKNKGMHVFASLIIEVVGAFLISWLLMHTKPMNYMKTVSFITMVGLIVGVLGIIPLWNWWGVGFCFTLVAMLDLVIGWFLAGLAMGKIVATTKK